MANDYQLHKVFIGTALLLRDLSHCVQHKSGAVLVRDGSIIAQGVNGTPHGTINCDEIFDEGNYNYERHDSFSAHWETTAEMNCIITCARNGVSCGGGTLYCTYIPKRDELKYFSLVGLKEIYYVYDDEITEEQRMNVYEACQRLSLYIERI